ncbi:unnamed protein product [Rangifer tarandus platyrhynchus]|uniref:Uncharacterized protein n=1 Tax=Rangifer tarandus platyrhynchus TaxID=3082113 RepID=A0AC60AA68_RANTA
MPRGVGPGSSRAGGGVRGALPRRGSLFCTSRAQGRRTALSRVRPAPGAGERDPGRPGYAAGCRLHYLLRCRIPPARPELPSSHGERDAHISPAPWPCAPSPTRESGTRGWREAGEGVAGSVDVLRVPLPPSPAGLRPPAPLTACLLQRRGETNPRICGWVRREVPGGCGFWYPAHPSLSRWHFLSSGYRQKGGDGASARKLSGVPWLQAQPHPPAGSSGARGGFAAASARRRAHACSPELRPAGAVRICRRCPHLDWPRPDPGTPRPLALPAPARCPGPAQGRAPRGCPTHRLRAAGLPSGPRGLRAAARRLAPSHRSGTRPPRPLGNSLQGDRAPPPAPTPGTEPTCAGVCGVPVPPAHAPPRPAPGFVREGRSRPGGAGAGEEGAFRGAPDPAAEAEAAGRARVVLL